VTGAEKANYKISWMCALLGVPRSSFYAWRNRAKRAAAARRRELAVLVTAAFEAGRGAYGCRRVTAQQAAGPSALPHADHPVGSRRVSCHSPNIERHSVNPATLAPGCGCDCHFRRVRRSLSEITTSSPRASREMPSGS
jgi:hypothetical protein